MELVQNIPEAGKPENQSTETTSVCYAFGVFRFYPGTLELFKNSKKIALKVQSAKVLKILIKNKGDLVSRDEIIHEIWSDRVVEFDLSLNACIRDIRTALEDDANQQKFIETLAKRGYRFNPKIIISEQQNGRPKQFVLRAGTLAFVGLVMAIVALASFQNYVPRTTFQNPASPEQAEAARVLVLAGVSAIYDGEVSKPQEAIINFQQALEVDPYYIEAHLMLARTVFARGRVDQMTLAQTSLEQILELDPDHIEALALLGSIKWSVNYDWYGAKEAFVKTIAIDPDYNRAYVFLAGYYSVMEDFNSSIGHIDLALSRDTVRLSENGNVGWFYYLAGRHEEALKFCDETKAINPEGPSTQRCYLNNLLVMGEGNEAARYALVYMKAKGIPENDLTNLMTASVSEVLEYFTRFEAGMVLEKNNRGSSSFLFKAVAQTRLGDNEGAIKTLNEAYQARNYFLPYIRVIPGLAPLQEEKGFQSLLKAMNFPASASMNS